ncbi:hypothetical protein KB1253_26130 [Lactiplantibacillus plantarum]|uniref:DUF1642 domain-containing protein n=1 Tax=Lactiplantibacillus plantarum TaxID=1590 RepID=UPI000FDC1A36|nr:DUF1642 domain-containing protein [Lactiplantibacillus plantarum]GCD87455.1 hypothetical protein KB1253_26130 [Lactiplantibacillus plantarum]
MSNETKRDVFEKALRKWDDLVHSCGLQGEEAHGGCEFDPILIKYKKDYDAALPDDLPVIPKVVADWIEKCKHDGTSVGDMLCSERRPEKMRDWMVLTPGTYEFNQRRYAEHQDLVARAWLDGYVVEEEK